MELHAHNWELCMYNEVAKKMLYDKCAKERIQKVFEYNRAIIRAGLAFEEDVSLARRELVAYFVSRHFCQIIQVRVLLYVAMNILEFPEPEYIGSYVMMIAAMLKTSLPTTEHINYVLFSGHLEETLEPKRCTRLNKELEINMYKYLHMRLLRLRRVLLSEDIWRQWVMEGTNCFAMDMDLKQALACVHIDYTEAHRHKLDEQVKSLRWRKQRKRKREGVEVHAQCGVCWDTMQVLELPCTHRFCENCLNPCKRCPICRAKLR